MSAIIALSISPLARVQAAKAGQRGEWFIIKTVLAMIAFFGIAFVPEMIFVFSTGFLGSGRFNSPFPHFRMAFEWSLFIVLGQALLISPAAAAGSLAAEKERGILGLLLTTPATSWEVVVASLGGVLANASIAMLALFPFVVWFGSLAGANVFNIVFACVFSMLVAFGASGVSLAAAVFSKRRRDALIAMYLVEIVLVIILLSQSTIFPGRRSGFSRL